MTDSHPTVNLEESEPKGVPMQADPEERLRRALGSDYTLGPVIGRGGMGIVYRAKDTRLNREVAIKILPPEVTYRDEARRRFVREAQLAASLTHPNIVPIYDVGEEDGLVWFVMALIQGESVRDLIRRSGPQAVHVATRVMREVAWALSYAHARGIVHRDIKPDNILLDRASGRALVTDFGLAKTESDSDNLTHSGGVVGTPAYMSPEQAEGKDITYKTDIYSLGVVGHYMLSGRNPFEASNARQVMTRVIKEQVQDVGNIRPDVPVWLSDAILKATARHPEERFKQCEDLAEALDRGQLTREIPPSIQYLLVWLEAYVELSVLAAWFIFLVGVPELPRGAGLIFACLISLPLLFSIQRVNSEGLQWRDIREGIVAWRYQMLRCINLKREAGIHFPSMAVLALTIGGVTFVRWMPTISEWILIRFSSWNQWVGLGTPWPGSFGPTLFAGPVWAFVYALLGSVIWAQLFGLPRAKHLSPQQLDKIASWRLPAWMNLLGALFFLRVRNPTQVQTGAAELHMLADPAVQAALAFNRTRRSLPIRNRIRLWYPILLGKMALKRLWFTHERMTAMKNRVRLSDKKRSGIDALSDSILRRQAIVTECAEVLEGVRNLMEQSLNTAERSGSGDLRIIEELKRVTRPLRLIRRFNLACVVVWLGGAVAVSTMDLNESMLRRADIFLAVSLFSIIILQFIKKRLYA